jgi:hypothetical protein
MARPGGRLVNLLPAMADVDRFVDPGGPAGAEPGGVRVGGVEPGDAEPGGVGRPGPSAALALTLPRWLAVAAALEVAIAGVVEGLLLFTHSTRGVAAFAWPLGLGATVGWLLIFAMLRAEESRLARELRTARTGTPVLRALVARRGMELPFLARWSSSKLGAAAVLLADGDREGAIDALGAGSVLMRGGRLDRLRAIVDADLERKTGTAAGLDRCVQRLRQAAPVGNREADLYRVHVLVKAVLEQGDGVAAVELAMSLGRSADDDERVYATWLRVWFDLDGEGSEEAAEGQGGEPGGESDGHTGAATSGEAAEDAAAEEVGDGGDPWPALSEGDLRMATLAARAHGAESLVSKLTLRLSAIARAAARG